MHQLQTTIESITGNLTSGAKILIATVPADGHVNPLTGIAKHLQAKGYDVRWYCSRSYEQKITKLKIPFYPFVKGLEVDGDNLEKAFPERKHIRNPLKKLNYDLVNFFIKRGPEYYSDIREISKEFPFELMISDCTFSAVPFVSDLMNIPVITIGIVPVMGTSKDLAPTGLGLTPDYSIYGRIKQNILRYVAHNIIFKRSNAVCHQIMDSYGVAHYDLSVFDLILRKSILSLQSGTPGFEYKRRDLPANIRFIGGLLPFEHRSDAEPWYDNRLNKYKKVVLVTQGTVEKETGKLLVPVLEAFKNSDTLVIATTGGSETADLQKKYAADNIIIQDFIPFNDVLPYSDAYITNGGFGGVMMSIMNHVPMVVAGVNEGKNEINARIGYFKVGINLKTERPSAYQVRQAVESLLQDDIYRKNVTALGKEFSSYPAMQICESSVSEVLIRSKSKLSSFPGN